MLCRSTWRLRELKVRLPSTRIIVEKIVSLHEWLPQYRFVILMRLEVELLFLKYCFTGPARSQFSLLFKALIIAVSFVLSHYFLLMVFALLSMNNFKAILCSLVCLSYWSSQKVNYFINLFPVFFLGESWINFFSERLCRYKLRLQDIRIFHLVCCSWLLLLLLNS